MIIRHLESARASNRRVTAEGWESVRLLLRNDNVGFSFHITTIDEGAELHLHYQHHFESVYCIKGKGEIENVSSGEVHQIDPGTIYVLDKHDQHILRAIETLEMACVFNPPLHGKEVHNAEGAYPTEAEAVLDDL